MTEACLPRTVVRSGPGLLAAVLLVTLFASPQAGAAEQLYTQQPPVTPALAVAGDLVAGVRTVQLTNPEQLSTTDFQSVADRELRLEIWYPAQAATAERASYDDVTRLRKPFSLQGDAYRDAEPRRDSRYPLVILSHGYTGYRSIMFYLGEHLASHGYVVASIDHTDSTNAEIDFVGNAGSGFASTLLNRARDQQFVLDALTAGDAPLSASIDSSRAAVIGYSMGGYGALNLVGGCYNFTPPILQAFGLPAEAASALAPVFSGCNASRDSVDPRWKAMVAFAPWGGQQNIHRVADIRVPALFIAGADDDISGFENGVAKLFDETGSANKYLLVYENARHNIAPHPAPRVAYETDADLGHYVEPVWNVEQLNRINRHMTLAFLDCHVKELAGSCAYLPERGNIAQQKGADGALSAPWPGFADRLGLGVRFYRGER